MWPHRSEVPRDVWGHLFSAAEREIGVLVYSGLFISEDAGVQKILKDKAAAGVRVRCRARTSAGMPWIARCGCASGTTWRDGLRRTSVYRSSGVLPDLLAQLQRSC